MSRLQAQHVSPTWLSGKWFLTDTVGVGLNIISHTVRKSRRLLVDGTVVFMTYLKLEQMVCIKSVTVE